MRIKIILVGEKLRSFPVHIRPAVDEVCIGVSRQSVCKSEAYLAHLCVRIECVRVYGNIDTLFKTFSYLAHLLPRESNVVIKLDIDLAFQSEAYLVELEARVFVAFILRKVNAAFFRKLELPVTLLCTFIDNIVLLGNNVLAFRKKLFQFILE